MKHQSLLGEYIDLFLLERIKGQTEPVSAHSRSLKTTAVPTFTSDEQLTKQQVDDSIAKALLGIPDKELVLADTRAKVAEESLKSLKDVVKANFERQLQQHVASQPSNAVPAFDPKLILSEIFMMDRSEADGIGQKDKEELVVSRTGNKGERTDSANPLRYTLTDFENDLKDQLTVKANCKKLFLFFDLLAKFDLPLGFSGERVETFEGHLLRVVYADDHNSNYFVLRETFQECVRRLVEAFHIDFEAKLTEESVGQSQHLVLLASFSPTLCQHLDRVGLVAHLCSQVRTMTPSQHHLLLKVLINLLQHNPSMIRKLGCLDFFPGFLDLVLKANSPSTLWLFALFMSQSTKAAMNPRSLLSKSQLAQFAQQFNACLDSLNALSTMAFKNKNKLTEFKAGSTTDPVVLLDVYCKAHHSMIQQVMSLSEFKRLHYEGMSFLAFASTSQPKNDEQTKLDYCRRAVDVLSSYYFQPMVFDLALSALKAMVCRRTIEFFLEEIFETNLVSNCFGSFDRDQLTKESVAVLSNFQSFLLVIVEACQLNGMVLRIRQIKNLLDRLCQIRQLVSDFHFFIKERYLAKGLLKYVSKLKKGLVRDLIFPLDEVLSQNALILQKLSHTQSLDENIQLSVSRGAVRQSDSQSALQAVSQVVANASQVLYIVSKVDRKEGYLDEVVAFNLQVLESIESFMARAESSSSTFEFRLVASVVEYLVVSIHFVKTYDESSKRISSVKVLKRAVDLFVRILGFSKHFVNVQSNHEIFVLLENLGLFWLLFFDFNYRFYDRMSYLFIDDLKTLSRTSGSDRQESFSDQTLFRLLVFLNDLVDLKSKDPLVNFVILKQLDTMLATLSQVSPLNLNFMVSAFQRVFGANYGNEIHRLQQKHFLCFSNKTLAVKPIRASFLDFVCRNVLFLNKYVSAILRNQLTKHSVHPQVLRMTPQHQALFNHAVLEEQLDPSQETTQFLLTLIQANIRNQTLFEDLLVVLRVHLKTADKAKSTEIVKRLFLSESVFWKLVRLYKKDQINLSKILKYLLLICKHFDFLTEIRVPAQVVRAILDSREAAKFHDVYRLLLTYLGQNGLLDQFALSVDRFFLGLKQSLDTLLFFSKKTNLDSNIRQVYYSLKVLRDCHKFVRNAQFGLEFDGEGYVVRYVLQLMDDNNRLEVVHVNNLFHHFGKRENVLANFKTTVLESKIATLVYDILANNTRLMETASADYFVVNKLVSFGYAVLDQRNFESFAELICRFLVAGLEHEDKDLFKEICYDLFLLLHYEFGLKHDGLAQLTKAHLCGQQPVQVCVRKVVEDLRRKSLRWDTMGCNSVIRSFLKLRFLLVEFQSQLEPTDCLWIVAAADGMLENFYKDIHSLTKLERLVVSLYKVIRQSTATRSVNSARIFLWLFNTPVEFKVSSLVDKFVYMGLFNDYLPQRPKGKQVSFVLAEGVLERAEGQPGERTSASLTFESKKVSEALGQLRISNVDFEKEVVLVKFLANLYRLNKDKFSSTEVQSGFVDDRLVQVRQDLEGFRVEREQQTVLLSVRLKLVLTLVKKERRLGDNGSQSLLTETAKLLPIVERFFGRKDAGEAAVGSVLLKVSLLAIECMFGVYRLAIALRESSAKQASLDSIASVWQALKETALGPYARCACQKRLLMLTVKVMRNGYEEIRVALHKTLLPSVFDYFESLTERVVGTVSVSQDRESVERVRLLAVEDELAVVELVLYMLYLVCKHLLLMPSEFKREILKRVLGQRDRLGGSLFCQVIIPLIEREVEEAEHAVAVSQKRIGKESKAMEGSVAANQVSEKLIEGWNTEKPDTAQLAEGQPDAIQAAEGQPVNAQPGEGQPVNAQPGEGQPVNAQPVNDQPTEGQPDTAQPVNSQPDTAPPIEGHPETAQPVPVQTQSKVPETVPNALGNSVANDFKNHYGQLNIDNMSTMLKDSSLSYKRKNIIYLHKVLATVVRNLEKNAHLSEREEVYLSFGLAALHKHLLEGLDKELFNAFGFFGLLADLATDNRVYIGFKKDALAMLRLHLKANNSPDTVPPNESLPLMSFYQSLFLDPCVEIEGLYFEVLRLTFRGTQLNDQFVNDYVDKLGYCLFEAHSRVSEGLFVAALAVFVEVLFLKRPTADMSRVAGSVYPFLKINNKDMKMFERTLFVMLLSHFERQGALDPLKLTNATHFVRFSHTTEGLDRAHESLDCLMQLTETDPHFQGLLRSVEFHGLYKLLFKTHSEDMNMVRKLSVLFLRCTHKADDSRFEMRESLRLILQSIRHFANQASRPGARETVVLLYKSLVNASLQKDNSGYLVKSDLPKVMIDSHLEDDQECAVVALSLLFNICFVFERHEVQMAKFVKSDLVELLGRVFDRGLESGNDEVIGELIDLFLGFIQHQYFDFFNLDMVRRVKLTLSLYHDSPQLILKFLGILREITLSTNQQVHQVVSSQFDYVFLYHLHYRNLKNDKVNLLVKQVILNLMNFREKEMREHELVTFGVPENVIHTFSTDDNERVMLLNLRVVRATLRFDKCLYFVRNHFLAVLSEILVGNTRQFPDDVISLALDVLRDIMSASKDSQQLNTLYYFDDIPRLFDLMAFAGEDEPKVVLLLKLLKTIVESDKGRIGELEKKHKERLQELATSKAKTNNRELLNLVSVISHFAEIHDSFLERQRADLKDDRLTEEDKRVMEVGQSVVLGYQGKLHPNAVIKYSFVKHKLVVSEVEFSQRESGIKKKKLAFGLSRVHDIGQTSAEANEVVEQQFKTYFMKSLKKDLYFGFLLSSQNVELMSMEEVHLIFENEFRTQKWKSLFERLLKK
jgi:hypothetical protein